MTHRSSSNHFAEIHASGLKVTTPRVKILRVFQQGVRRHWSAEEVYQALLAEGADIGLATVYRVLMQFVQAGLLTRTHFETGKGSDSESGLPCPDCVQAKSYCSTSGALGARLQVPTRAPFIQRPSVRVWERRPMAYQAGLSADELEASDACSGLASATSTPRMLNSLSRRAAPTLSAFLSIAE